MPHRDLFLPPLREVSGDRKGITKTLCDKDFAERSGEPSGAICHKPLWYWAMTRSPSNCSEKSLRLVRAMFLFLCVLFGLRRSTAEKLFSGGPRATGPQNFLRPTSSNSDCLLKPRSQKDADEDNQRAENGGLDPSWLGIWRFWRFWGARFSVQRSQNTYFKWFRDL